jgi:PAS domain S-box-containing protein
MPKLKGVFITILSGVAAEENLDFVQLGANACIAKGPFNKMAEHVLAVLEQFERQSPHALSEGIRGREDIHERETTKELLSAKRHFEAILKNMSEGIVEVTPDGKIVFTNAKAISLFGIPEQQLLGSDFGDLFCETDRERVEDLMNGITGGPETIPEESPLIINRKQICLTLIRVPNDREHSLIAVLKDVTEKRQLEEYLLQNRKMEGIATLAGGIAHEFNNALFAVSGNLELLEMETQGNGNLRSHLEPATRSVGRMAALTKQLLAYARKGRYRSERVSFSTFVEESLALIRHGLPSSIKVDTELREEGWSVEVDRAQLQMAITAIVENAVETIEGEGHIWISTGYRQIDGESEKDEPGLVPGRYVSLTIRDDGKGMDEETKNRVFEPFFTTKFQGRGLGMAAVYGIIGNHRGWISVDSELGRGTSVRILLPVTGVRSGAEVKSSGEPARGSGTVLLIEDEEAVIDVSRAMLEHLGYRTVEAKTGMDGISLARTYEGVIDLALLDIGLPDMDGSRVFGPLTEACPDLKVIICSGYGIDGAAGDILNAGAHGFIQKPFTINALSAKLDEVLKE